MPFWARLIGDGDAGRLFHMQTNLRFGCVILRHYLDRESGDLYLALGRYNGSRGKPEYPNAVFGARRAWEFSPALSAASGQGRPRPSARAPSTPSRASTRSTVSSTISSIVCGR